MDGTLSRAIAIIVPGKLLSHPEIQQGVVSMSSHHNLIESAITSRLTKDAFMPSCPIAMRQIPKWQ